MTLKELSQLYYYRNEMKYLEEQITTLDAMGDVQELTKLRDILSARKLLCVKLRTELEAYISTIDDSLTRQIIHHRFVCACSWRQVAQRVGGGNSAEGVKKICYRFLRQSEGNREK